MLARRKWLRTSLAVLGVAVGVGVASAHPPAVLPPIPDVTRPPVVVVVREEAAPAPTPPATSPANAPPAACDPCAGFDFKKVPPARVFPRPGMFPIAPTGPGYYSALDALRDECREKPPQFGYPPFALMQPSFFDADWRYLDDPKTPSQDVLDRLKRIRVGDNWLLSVGGATWFRYFDERNSRLTGRDIDYAQVRSRVYTDLWYRDVFRLYAEGIYADTYEQELPRLPIDSTRFDFLNLFVDAKLGDVAGQPVYARVGRQELLFGSQRLISPLDWANTRRTFQGARFFRTSEKFDFDLFWAQPVVPNPTALDSIDNNQNFAGAWATYKPKKGTFLDLYYLMLDNTNTVVQQNIVRAPATTHTIGSRFAGDRDSRFLWDFEGAVQVGRRGSGDIFAGMATAGVGYHPENVFLNPTLWLYYDYASGDKNPNAGNFTTFNQLFPFGHYYFGWADVVARQNVHDVSASLHLYPAKWLTLWLQYHNFWLDSSKDALYSAGGVALRRDPTGRAGNFVGNEVDVILNFHLSKRTDFLVAYSYLFAGEFLRNTQPPGTGSADVSSLYMIFNVRW
jgi:hypothetical protein